MKNKAVQVILIIICVSTFFIIKDINDSKNPFEKLDRGPDRATYINWNLDDPEESFRRSTLNDQSKNRELIIEYFKSLKCKKLSNAEKNLYIGLGYGNEEYWLRYNTTIKTGDFSSEVITDNIIIDYIYIDGESYLTIRSDHKDVKSGTYRIVGTFDGNIIQELLNTKE